MRNLFVLLAALSASLLVSGCALVSSHTSAVEGGTKTTVGLFAIDKIDNGYPMLPVYSGFKKN
jgi:uncharacterized protein YceK